ncbi:hypothetical protein [Streptomyces sp. NPDC048172]|uniref:hypothetical protein n=1 Tax=Streptomyces sp. NPDC048172 TaxID=3365505 RepID=UPI00371ED442
MTTETGPEPQCLLGHTRERTTTSRKNRHGDDSRSRTGHAVSGARALLRRA